MKAPSAILRNLSFRRIQPRSAPVAPSPVRTQFDRELAAGVYTIQSLGTSGELGLVQLLDAAITTQKIALDSLANISYSNDLDRGAIEEYLESNIDILDGCNYYVEKIGHMKKYLDSLRVVAHLVDVGSSKPNCMATKRAMDHLDSCHDIEKSCKAMEKQHASFLRRMLRQRLVLNHETVFSEIVCGSKAMALMGCRFLELALSFDSKNGFPLMKQYSQPTSSSWLRLLQEFAKQADNGSAEKGKCVSLVMIELQQTVNAARELKEEMKGRMEKKEVVESSVERLNRCCKELEDRLEVIEGRVKDIYRSLIDVRMALLGILSQA